MLIGEYSVKTCFRRAKRGTLEPGLDQGPVTAETGEVQIDKSSENKDEDEDSPPPLESELDGTPPTTGNTAGPIAGTASFLPPLPEGDVSILLHSSIPVSYSFFR